VVRVTVPGSGAPLDFQRTDDALIAKLPSQLRNPIGIPLILSGSGLTEGSLVEA